MKFLVDESTGKRLAKLLATIYDALYVGDVLKSASDEDVLEFAEREGRILITDDRDFGKLVFVLRKPSSGVIFLKTLTTNAEERFKILLKVFRTVDLTLSATKVGRFLLLAHWEP